MASMPPTQTYILGISALPVSQLHVLGENQFHNAYRHLQLVGLFSTCWIKFPNNLEGFSLKIKELKLSYHLFEWGQSQVKFPSTTETFLQKNGEKFGFMV